MRSLDMLAPLLLAFGGLAMSSSACSSSSDSGATSGADGGAGAAICTPTLRTLAKPNTAAYRFFASDAEAVADATTLLARGMRPAPLPPGSPQQAQAEAIIAEVYPAFRTLYPEQTEGLDSPPRVIVVNDKSPNAFAAKDDGSNPPTAPWYMFFDTGAFATTVTRDDLMGVVAHEMSHLILRNSNDALVAAYARHYKTTDGAEAAVYGASQPDDPAVSKRTNDLEALRRSVGPIGFPDLLGVPYSPLATSKDVPTYIALWNFVYAKYKAMSPSPASCTKLDTDLAALKATFKGHVVGQDYAVVADAAFKADVKAKAAVVRDDMVKCLPGFKKTLAALLQEQAAAQAGFTPPALDAEEQAAEAKYKGTSFVAELLELGAAKNAELAALEAKTDLPLDSLRIYRAEEDADDASAYVMHALHKDPRSAVLFLLHTATADYASACIAKAKGQATSPTYGALRNDHPATCWRYWNLDRLATALDASCP